VYNFVHDPGPLHLSGIRSANQRALTERLLEISSTSRLVVADLTLGAWRHFQVAREIFTQLGVSPSLAGTPRQARPNSSLPPPSRVGHRIDRETRGDQVVMDAFHLTGKVVQALVNTPQPTTFCVLTSAHAWDPADALFVRFLTQSLQSTDHRILLVLCGSDDTYLPRDWIVNWLSVQSSEKPTRGESPEAMLHLIPGIVTADIAHFLDAVAADLETLIPLSGGCFLVPPCSRCELGSASREQYDRLAAVASQVDWLAAYGNYWGSNGALNPTPLWEYGRAVFDASGLNLAIRLLERAISRARTPAERAVFEIMAQGARILSGRFEDVAGVEPHEHLAPELRGWLSFTGGWGLTMLEKPTDAEPYLESARNLLGNNGDTDEYLYVLNISALNRLKLGDWEGAFAQEQRIRSKLDRITAGRWQISYINSLNLARLYRRRGRLDEAEQAYLEAFSTSFGVWSDSDALYLNVCLAKLHEARGQFQDALQAWTRAALYWVSSAVPEATSSRVMNAIVGSKATNTAGNVIDDVTIALASYLLVNAKAAGLEHEIAARESDDSNEAAAFVKPDMLAEATTSSSIWHALSIADSWGFGLEERMAPVVDTEPNRILRRMLSALVSPVSEHGGMFPAIVVDDQLGCGLPETEAEMLAACLRLGVRVVRVSGKSVNLDGNAGQRATDRLRVRLANPVSQVKGTDDGVFVTFKRYLEPQILSGAAADAARSIANLTDAPAQDFDISVLRELERERIVDLFLPEDISAADFAKDEGL
jgi:tetratricopeptide (TPR) repeat protein